MMWSRRKILKGVAGLAGAAACSGPANAFTAPGRKQIIAGPAFGSSWRITLPGGVDGVSIRRAVMAVIASIDSHLSPFREGSEISRFNGARKTGWMAVSDDTSRVMAAGLAAAKLTGGAFDPTIGPVVGQFGFGPIRHGGRIDHQTGWAGISVRPGAVEKKHRGLTFDPCGIAKGYALDRVVTCLDEAGVEAFLVELGGEVFARGLGRDGHNSARPWQVGIERPVSGPTNFQRIVSLRNNALATSGDAVNGYSLAGRRYSHIIDPARSAPVDNGVASVSVIAPSAMTADALATALMVMGPGPGLALAVRENLAVLFILRGGGGRLTEAASEKFKSHVVA